jgi:hypothetical protein
MSKRDEKEGKYFEIIFRYAAEESELAVRLATIKTEKGK